MRTHFVPQRLCSHSGFAHGKGYGLLDWMCSFQLFETSFLYDSMVISIREIKPHKVDSIIVLGRCNCSRELGVWIRSGMFWAIIFLATDKRSGYVWVLGIVLNQCIWEQNKAGMLARFIFLARNRFFVQKIPSKFNFPAFWQFSNRSGDENSWENALTCHCQICPDRDGLNIASKPTGACGAWVQDGSRAGIADHCPQCCVVFLFYPVFRSNWVKYHLVI